MKRFTRLEEPQIIQDHGAVIGQNYAQRRLINPNYSFSWPQINNQRINHSILPVLREQTNNHCSYCDKFPLHKGDNTIDHFKPKTNSLYYLFVCQWENLYLACKHCQDSKGTKYDDLLLRPDDPNFDFSNYFVYNYSDHTIEANPSANDGDQQRAQITIEILDLNFPDVKTSRRHAFERYNAATLPDLNDYNYRFMFE
jgi:uncharacterized protein (TIGR02646 family)